MKVLEKFLQRDVPLIAAECWYDGRTKYFPRFFSYSYHTTLFRYKNGAFESFSDIKGFEIELPKKIARWLKNKNNDITKVHQYMIDGLKYFESINLEQEASVNEVFNYLEKVKELFTQGYLGVLVTHQLPIFQEKFKQRGLKLFNQKLVDQIIGWREAEGNIFFNNGVSLIYLLLDRIAQKNGWDRNLLRFITFSELKKCIEKSSPLPTGILEKRKNSIFIYFNHKIFYENEIKKILKKYDCKIKEKTIPKDIKEFRGSIANKGHAVGKVKIVLNRQQINKVKKGDILVSSMTSAYHVPAMERAAAIVTDEGGVTCHAAIISRELNKPCIIGTKIATQVLKDGDLVEVDANLGLVKILKA